MVQAPEPDGISLEVESDGVTAQLVWSDPDSELPSSAIQILVNDSMGATAVRNISVVLCACANDGRCINSTTLQCNSNGHYLQECECPDFFSGDLCETDERSCSDSSCPESSQCETNSSVPAGYTCSACQEGYELDEDGKCTGERLYSCTYTSITNTDFPLYHYSHTYYLYLYTGALVPSSSQGYYSSHFSFLLRTNSSILKNIQPGQ